MWDLRAAGEVMVPVPTPTRTGRAFGEQPRWRSPAAAVLVALLVLLVGHSAMLHPESHAPHPPHALLSSLGGEVSMVIDHAHLLDGSSTDCHNELATAVLPRSSTTLVPLGVAAAVVAITTMPASLVPPAGRGPPSTFASAPVGQDISTRFCVSRR
ncbi:putative copper homeostasis (lipo)protein LpqS [Mycobacterium camsae]|uniref:hypothetical protein n=1 Tax=Mycobacterium gordonae TaxID=1778 RepID=UPI001F12081E|nr:hypothetical protein [Mycobacterium gordonae]